MNSKEKKNFNIVIPKKNMVEISCEEYARLKDIETRFEILKREMILSEYCPIHHQVIFGIENERANKAQEVK